VVTHGKKVAASDAASAEHRKNGIPMGVRADYEKHRCGELNDGQ
jgi:hypothetical protein